MNILKSTQEQRITYNNTLLCIVAMMILYGSLESSLVSAAPSESVQMSTCKRELENANRTLSKWANTMETMVNESKLPSAIRETIHNEANTILDMIEEFGEQIPTQVPAKLTKDLVTIRRRSNRMALDIYLNTLDMRWPQNSLQVAIIVERVQQACLDKTTIQALESPPNPLEELLKHT